ncbi:hypothetical protein [Priestia flexa]|uniref:hypothetical protein n=1 Tax=Priestia flexa TaxID=86664 RepID=UPI0004743428|nr:hypothetical protein [Priestia flexa]
MKKILQHGLTEIQAKHNSEVNIELQGTTLLPMTNSTLHKDKYYVLANEDKKTSVIQNNEAYNGVAKFKGYDDRITLKRKINFSNKISGSISTNPHVMKKGGVLSLQLPSSSELQEVEQNFYNNINSYDLGSTSHTYAISTVNQLSQVTVSINLISEIEKHLGKIPYSSLSAKREWVKVNIGEIVLTYSGLQAKINVFSPNDNTYADATRYDHNTTIMKKYNYRLTSDANTTPRLIKDLIDSNGFIHFTVYGNKATSTSPSNLIIDLLEIEFSLKKDSNLQVPRVPLYEVTSEEYEKILYQWDEKKVCAIFPPVDGLQSLTTPYFKNESNPNVELFADVILRGMYGISDTLRRREGKWSLVKEWEQIDVAIVENQAPFNIKFRDYILVMDKSDKKDCY